MYWNFNSGHERVSSRKRNDERVKITIHTEAHRLGVQEYLFIQNAPMGQPITTESNAIAPVISVAVDESS